MSKELDQRIDTLRKRLITTAATPVGVGNYKAQMRAYQEMLLEVINILDSVNALEDAVSATEMEALKVAIKKAVENPEGEM